MAADPLDQVLRLVAEGRLTAEEAAPILAALDASPIDARPAAADQPDSGRRASGAPGSPGTLRIEVRDHGRPVVSMRLSAAAAKFGLDHVPGLSEDQVRRVREALSSGFRGSVLEVDDQGDGVRIILE